MTIKPITEADLPAEMPDYVKEAILAGEQRAALTALTASSQPATLLTPAPPPASSKNAPDNISVQRSLFSVPVHPNYAPTTFCVYEHVINDAGQAPLFIGISKLSELFKCEDARRNDEWIRQVKAFGRHGLRINVLHITIDYEDAERSRDGHVEARRPHANRYGREIDAKAKRVMCVDTGVVWPSAADAARDMNIAATTMSHHLNGRKGYSLIRKMQFKRIM